jgi:TPR repeat protein
LLTIQNPFIQTLKPPFKFSPDSRGALGRGAEAQGEDPEITGLEWGSDMAQTGESYHAAVGQLPASAEGLLDLGIMYSSGRNVAIDYVTAHKWFNLAAMKGSRDAARLRREIAAEMSEAEIAAAQRAARDWLRTANHSFAAAA